MTAKHPLLLIDWIDASKNSAWMGAGEATIDHPSATCRSVGWLHAEDEKYILLVSSTGNGHSQVCLQMQIPKVAIVRRKRLKESR
jgi:hypothetical protein